MKKLLILLFAAAVIAACQKTDVPNIQGDLVEKGANLNGNDMPNGAHYNLNIIGVPKEKKNAVMDNNGHRIFVPLWGNTKIYLQEGDDFDVIDANATDVDGGMFQLPNPVADGVVGPLSGGTVVATKYTVYARALGKPGVMAKLVTCAEGINYEDETIYAPIECGDTLYVERNKKGPVTQNVTRQLLFVTVMDDVYYDVDDDPITPDELILKKGNYPLFDEALEDYFWYYDNDGLKVLQLRFYMIPDEVTMAPTN